MRSTLGFFSLLAFGILAAGVLSVIGSGTFSHSPLTGLRGDDIRIDLASLLIGLACGILLATLARVSWSELPARTATWLMANERNFARLAWAGLFVVVLLFY